jgi:hypothetical protein
MSAGDFYFAINATFRHICETYGREALIRYWTDMAHEYHADVAERFRAGGLAAVRDYWAAYFAAEPGGHVEVVISGPEVEITVHDCPAIRWLRDGGRAIVPYYCEHCHHISTAIAEQAGLGFHLEGGGGACRQTFARRGEAA